MTDSMVGPGAHLFHVQAEQAGARLDKFLAGQATLIAASVSRTRIKSLVEAGHVLVGDAVVREAGTKLSAGDPVTVDLPPPADPVPRPEAIPLLVVFEDDQVIVVDKPAGLVVHPAAGNETGTLVNALLAHCGDTLSGIGGVKRPGIVHRLDKDTSGLMVVAKTDSAHHALAALFADHGRTLPFVREYRALVWGVPARAAGVVDLPLDRHSIHRERMAVVPEGRGRHAVTHWQVAQTFSAREGVGVASEITCQLETGRTHQIRVHLAHGGHPVLGDETYGSGYRTKAALLSEEARHALVALDRQALHASVLAFPHPRTGRQLTFESALPPDLALLRTALLAG